MGVGGGGGGRRGPALLLVRAPRYMDSACWITNSGDLKSPLPCQAGAPLPFVSSAVDGDLHFLISSL